MKAKTTLNLKCLTVATVALLAILPVQAGAARSPDRPAQATLERELRPVTGSPHQAQNPVRPTGSGKSYFWAEAGIAGALLAGFLALGLWGDRAVGGVIFAIQRLCVGAAWPARKVRAHTSARSRALALGATVVVALTAALGATATTPGRNGLIVYAQELRPEHYQLFTIRSDGSGAKQITHLVNVANPDWSLSGETIVAEVESRSGAGITLLSPTGTVLRNLTPKGFQGQPSFSPDGKWIVYERDIAPGNNGVWLMRSNGTALRRVTRNPFGAGECGCDTDPNFSPNGNLITFVRIKKADDQQALFAVRRNGSGLRQLTPYSWNVAIKHDWSPDGKLIVLTTNADLVRPGESANLVTIRPDGSAKTDLTGFTGGTENAFAGSFSPDGQQIVFRIESGDTASLAVIDRNGGNLRRLTTGKAKPRYIDWGTHP